MPKNAHQIKALTTQLSKAKAHKNAMWHEMAKAERNYKQAEQDVERLEALINTDDTGPRVTEHAILRYLERVKGMDLGALHREILTPEIIAGINAGASRIPLQQGGSAVIKGKNIVSITQ